MLNIGSRYEPAQLWTLSLFHGGLHHWRVQNYWHCYQEIRLNKYNKNANVTPIPRNASIWIRIPTMQIGCNRLKQFQRTGARRIWPSCGGTGKLEIPHNIQRVTKNEIEQKHRLRWELGVAAAWAWLTSRSRHPIGRSAAPLRSHWPACPSTSWLPVPTACHGGDLPRPGFTLEVAQFSAGSDCVSFSSSSCLDLLRSHQVLHPP
ncbi:unnamed protein product [Nesidiocoris tenuis]|uniref:Uncharacterized protein n=1 Tax=Nesidiocoris tenuis TaxID=355587 RepID=A0A6H5H7I1_9HEMI|nr:unnamed protein product [Nesidiocoris tenuis]